MEKNTKTVVVVLAAGRGARMGADLPKQYRLLAGVPLLRRTLLQIFKAKEFFDRVIVVLNPEHRSFYEQAIDGLPQDIFLTPVNGGATRQQSVYAALKALQSYGTQNVLLHDAARPFVSPALFQKTFAALNDDAGAICAVKMADTLKQVVDGTITNTIARDNLYAAQTPQAFRFSVLLDAHQLAEAQGRDDFTDDAALLEWQGHAVRIIESSADNFKLTTQEDWQRAEAAAGGMITRSALGFDVHRFAAGDHVMLGGVRLPHVQGIDAHSDGDVVLHALTDAVLGLIGAGDIGRHFPPGDPQWRNAPSDIFVKKALGLLHERGGRLTHCDISLIAEAPKIGPYREKISRNVASLLALPLSSIGLKATTAEGLGLIGNGEGLCAYVLVTATFGD